MRQGVKDFEVDITRKLDEIKERGRLSTCYWCMGTTGISALPGWWRKSCTTYLVMWGMNNWSLGVSPRLLSSMQFIECCIHPSALTHWAISPALFIVFYWLLYSSFASLFSYAHPSLLLAFQFPFCAFPATTSSHSLPAHFIPLSIHPHLLFLFFLWSLVYCTPLLFLLSASRTEDEICHSDKENKSQKSLLKLQGQQFFFLGDFNFKMRKKIFFSLLLLPQPLLCSHCCEPQGRLGASREGQPDKKLLLGSEHFCAPVPSHPRSFWLCLSGIQAENGRISIFNKGNWRKGRQLRKAEGGKEAQIYWQSTLPF
jgi:hypothetical protein